MRPENNETTEIPVELEILRQKENLQIAGYDMEKAR